MLDKINTAIDETIYKDYQPLTDDQRDAMSETQITTWEKKAKSGLFHNDSILKELSYSMRNHMTSKVDNGSTYTSMSSIGITTKSYTERGKLYINETKLRAAIQADPDGVKNLFSQSTGTAATRVPNTAGTNYVAGTMGLVNMSTAGDTTGATITVDNQSFDIAAALNIDWSAPGTTLTNVVAALKKRNLRWYYSFRCGYYHNRWN